jgi:hypothetical protein
MMMIIIIIMVEDEDKWIQPYNSHTFSSETTNEMKRNINIDYISDTILKLITHAYI